MSVADHLASHGSDDRLASCASIVIEHASRDTDRQAKRRSMRRRDRRRSIDHTTRDEPLHAFLECHWLRGDGNDPSDRLAAFGNRPLVAELSVAKQFAEPCFRNSHANSPFGRLCPENTRCSAHDYIMGWVGIVVNA